MKLDVFNKLKEKIDTAEVSDGVFAAEWKPEMVRDVIVAYLANKRNPIAHTKDRSEVSGGGKKPWKQKHTGRARHGSRRSPIWIGGGITFGPRNDKDYSKKINQKAKKQALFSVLSKKREDGEIFIVDNLDFPEVKTKNAAKFLNTFFNKPTATLIVRNAKNATVYRAARNIPNVDVISENSLNAYDCSMHKVIVFEKSAAEGIK